MRRDAPSTLTQGTRMSKMKHATGEINSRLSVLRRRAVLFGVPLCIGLGFALSTRMDLVINNTPIATAISFYLVISIGFLWASSARHQMTLQTLTQLEFENEKLYARAVKRDLEANYDGLTKLPNVRLLPDRFNQAVVRAKRNRTHIALYLVTLDDFNPINARYGLTAATKAIRVTAERLKSALRDSDTIVRVGNSDFVILVESIKEISQIEGLTPKLHSSLGKLIELDNVTLIRAHEKIARATYPGDGECLEKLIEKARSNLPAATATVRKLESNMSVSLA